jgi:N-acetylglucosamine-6-phosphate deacetylase
MRIISASENKRTNMNLAFTGGRIFTGNNIVSDKAVVITDGVVDDILPLSSIPSGYEIYDLKGRNLAPALIDLQIYGGNGKMFSHELSVDALQSTYDYCVEGGASHFMVTMATNSIEAFYQGIDAVQEYWDNGGKGLLGLHLEGPYLNPAKKGAHIENFIKKPQREEVLSLIDRKPGVVRMITIAPEQCDKEIIELLLERDIIVSAGHTNATFAEATEAFAAGIPVATHLFNAMSAFQSREPGMVGAIYDHRKAMSSIVCDGVHVDFAAVRISKQLMKDRLFFITDAVTEVTLGAYQHIFRGDRYTLPDGTLSGSSLTMMQCVRNGVHKVGIGLEEALRMASTYPAKLLKPSRKLGRIEPGYEASFVIFDDDLNVHDVVTR